MATLDLDGAWVFTPQIHIDQRGHFHEWFSNSVLDAEIGRHLDVYQANCSVSRHGVIRGIHFTDIPPGQAKYITCVHGSILDVIVDIRLGSPTFGHWVAVELTAENRKAVFISEGLGHGFAALTDNATVSYLCSTAYDPSRERAVHPLDADLAIGWPGRIAPILSAKDASAPSLAAAAEAGLLPDYARCRDLVGS
jgi:dTDP-4-dehydrorhamnose 3,5-epimerase